MSRQKHSNGHAKRTKPTKPPRPQPKQHGLASGITAFADGAYRLEDAQKPLRIFITKQHVEIAQCKVAANADPAERGHLCVIYQSLTESQVGVLDAEVGSRITKLLVNGVVYRYATGAVLRAALKEFDNTGQWKLPEGVYVLMPPSGNDRMTKNCGPDRQARKRANWKQWNEKRAKRLAAGDTAGRGGLTGFKQRPLLSRRISITRTRGGNIPLNDINKKA